MGTPFRTIVDPVASLEEAAPLAKNVIHYLIERRIIRPERTDCTLGKVGGFAPGENVEEAFATWTPHHSPGLPLPVETLKRDLMRWRDNGVEEVIDRTVFHNWDAGLDVVRCPLCQANQKKADWGEALNKWSRGDDLALFRCPNCQESSPITQWTFDPPWAFGNLGFNFWSWPPLKRSFIEQISGILGHKVVLISGQT